MNEISNKPEIKEVQKLQLYDMIEYLLELDKETQITVFKILCNDLGLINIKDAMRILGKSYNGVKNHSETVTIGKTKFYVSKDLKK